MQLQRCKRIKQALLLGQQQAGTLKVTRTACHELQRLGNTVTVNCSLTAAQPTEQHQAGMLCNGTVANRKLWTMRP
jgi:hypothetical protein